MSYTKSINELSTHLFWDVDIASLDIITSKKTIIERVLGYGILNDWNWIVSVYGKDQIKNTALTLKNIDKVTLSFLANLFSIPKENFSCYTKIQSANNFWEY